MGVERHGGIGIDGLPPIGEPSPDGQWSRSLDEDYLSLDRDEFTRVLYKNGDLVLWEKAAFCPNSGGASPQDHKIGCTVCNGSGYVFFAGKQTKMLITSATLKQMYFAYGRWDHGAVMITSLPGDQLSYFDRLTLLNRKVRFSEKLRRQPGTLYDRPKFDAASIEFAAWANRNGVLTPFNLAGATPDVQVVTSGPYAGQLLWGVNRPDDNAYYTISYTFKPVYRVLDLPHQHRAATVPVEMPPPAPNGPGAVQAMNQYDFPCQAVGVLDFLVRDEGRDAPQVADTDPFAGR